MEAGATPPPEDTAAKEGPLAEAPPAAEVAEAAEAAPAPAPLPAASQVDRLEKTPDERKAQLDSALQLKGAQGWRIENRSDFQATVAKGKQHSHGIHIFLTIITVGLWLLAWIPLAVFGGLKRRMISVDVYGNVVEQNL